MNYRDEVRNDTRDGSWTFWHILPRAILAILALIAIGYLLTWLFRPAAIVTRVTQPDRMIQNYEWFEETYNDAKALDQKIKATQAQIDSQFSGLPEDRNDWSRENTTEFNRLNAVLVGLRSQRESIVADYNARSKLVTRNLWKGQDLPYQLQVVDDLTMEVWEK